jgi:hypothetical protein
MQSPEPPRSVATGSCRRISSCTADLDAAAQHHDAFVGAAAVAAQVTAPTPGGYRRVLAGAAGNAARARRAGKVVMCTSIRVVLRRNAFAVALPGAPSVSR